MMSDVIIVGAGSAGCVLAARLSEDPARRVTLLEAGGRDRNPLLRVPLMTGVLLRSHYANWFYHTEPEPNLGGRRSFWARGRVLGGSSSINGMVWARGRPSDFDGWAQAGLPGWSWSDALAAFRRIERFQGGESEAHGGAGPLPITDANVSHPLLDTFVQAGVQAGYPFTGDFNADPFEGVGRYHFNISGGQRWSAARAYLDPARGRPNLRILTGAHVQRVLIEHGRAVGVQTAAGPVLGGEVVLCGGTVNSPQLLMLSGIGAPDELSALGITPVADVAGVGRNLQDHLLVRVEHACTQPITLQSLTRMDRAAFALVQALVARTGPAASFPLAAGFFLRSSPSLEEPDLQGHFLPGLTTGTLRVPGFAGPARVGEAHGFMANVTQMRPESRGRITLRSADPKAAPLIQPNYLSDPRDGAVLRAGARVLRTIFAQPAFDAVRGAETSPGPAVQTDEELDAWIARTADTMFHPVGTCRMGSDTDLMAVVDASLRVRGVAGLRVADASIMPRITSGNTNAPSMLVGHRCADFMLQGVEAAMKHRSHRFSIDYIGADGQKRGQEHCHVTVHQDGSRTLRATSEIFDSEVLRDVVYTVDSAYCPRELLVRVSLQDRFVGSGWFQISDTMAEGESLTAAEGRLSQRLPLGKPALSFITHAVSSDVWHAASIPRIVDPGGILLDPVLTCSPRHNGSTGPMLSFWPLRAFYLGEETIEIPAGSFATDHIRYEEPSGELFLDTWCTADGDRVMVKMWYPPYQSSYLLTSLVHDPS